MVDPWLFPLFAGVGLACGFINVIAGGGSFITLPLLIFGGLPPVVANGTNRVAILMQNIVGVREYRQQDMLDMRIGKPLILPVLAGSLVGARIAISFDERLMTLAIASVMTVMFFVLLRQPSRHSQNESEPVPPTYRTYLLFAAIGVYGGFIQAGAGLCIMFALLASGCEAVRANAIRLLLILCYTPLALAVFVLDGQVYWTVGLALAAGSMAGAWVGVRVAVRRGAGFVRTVLLLVIAASACKLFWDAIVG